MVLIKTLLLSIILHTLLSIPAIAESETKIGFSGSQWLQFNSEDNGQTVKIAFVRGIYEGIYLNVASKEDFLAKISTTLSYRALAKALDEFYMDEKNHKIWVVDALGILKMREDGTTEEEIIKKTEELREDHLHLLNK